LLDEIITLNFEVSLLLDRFKLFYSFSSLLEFSGELTFMENKLEEKLLGK